MKLAQANLRILATILVLLAPILSASVAVWGLSAFPVLAQDENGIPDYETWTKAAERAEIALTEKRASDAAIELLRSELVGWRKIFSEAQEINAARLETLKSQLESLGPVPDDGLETEEVSARRSELEAQISALDAPRRVAEEAFNRAVGLIRECDTLIRERQTDSLLERGASPLDPNVWAKVIRVVTNFTSLVVSEVSASFAETNPQKPQLGEIAFGLTLAFAALVLFLRASKWTKTLARYGERVENPSLKRLVDLGVSVVGTGALAGAGFLVVEAIFAANLAGFRGQLVVDSVFYVFLLYLGARLLADRILQPDGFNGSFKVPSDALEPAKRHAGWLGLAYGMTWLVSQISSFEVFETDTTEVLLFPFLAMAGVFLALLGNQLRRHAPQDQYDDEPQAIRFQDRLSTWIGKVCLGVGFIAPLIALFGFNRAGLALATSWVETLALVSVAGVIAAILRDLYGWVSGKDNDELSNALIPVLLGSAVMLAALPFLALVWGTRTSELADLWTRFLTGFRIGDLTISPAVFVTFAAVFAIGYLATKAIQTTLRNSVLPKTRIDPGAQVAIVSGTGYVGLFLAALVAISTAGINLSSLAIVAGALSVGIGFGLQNIVSNFVSGIILLIERPIAEGDWIEAGGYMGTVKDISVRSTRIETFDRSDVIVPNADLVSGAVINYTRGNTLGRVIVPVGVAYGSDTRKVQELLEEIVAGHAAVTKRPGAVVHFVGFGADSLDFEIRAVLRDINQGLGVKTELRHEIANRFADEGIEIPFAQRDVWIRNPEALADKSPTEKTAGKPK